MRHIKGEEIHREREGFMSGRSVERFLSSKAVVSFFFIYIAKVK